jgi:hypothetical protein
MIATQAIIAAGHLTAALIVACSLLQGSPARGRMAAGPEAGITDHAGTMLFRSRNLNLA